MWGYAAEEFDQSMSTLELVANSLDTEPANAAPMATNT
jgi:hypothetical protein